MPHKFPILEPNLHYLRTFPNAGRGYLLDYANITPVNPYDKKPHSMAEMVKGILLYDPLLELLCSFQPRADLQMSSIITRYVTRVVPRQYVSDLPTGADFEICSYSDPRGAFGRSA